jgi:hypothetical protein
MTEYVYCVDSANIMENPNQLEPTDNPTNDIIVKVQMSTDKVIFKAIELVTLELPSSQRLIEDQWSRIYFMTPLPFDATSRTFQILDCNNQVIEAVLPVTDNLIVALDDTDPTTPVFTTNVDHLLNTASRMWTFGKPWTVIGVAEEFEVTKMDGTLQDNVTVLSATEFSVSGFSSQTVWKQNVQATSFGYLDAPPIASYEYLTSVLTRLLWIDYRAKVGAVSKAPFLLKYDVNHGTFTIRINPAIETKIPDCIYFSKMQVNPGSLEANLGFCTGTHKFYSEDVPFCTGESGCRSANTKQDILRSNAGATLGICSVRLNPGSYPRANDLISEINAQFNRMWFDPLVEPHILTLSDITGQKYSVTLPAGFYTPKTLSTQLTGLLLVAMPAHQIKVEFLDTEFSDGFIIQSENRTPFSLEFNELDTNIQFKIGFQPNRYSGGNRYLSNIRFEYSQCAGMSRFSECIIRATESAPTSLQLTVTGSLPPTTYMAFTTMNSGQLRAVSVSHAHGFQFGDIAALTIQGVLHHLRIQLIVSGTEFLADLGALDLGIPPDTVGSASHIGHADVSIMLAPRQNNSFIANVLGFPPIDLMYQPNVRKIPSFLNTLTAPYTMDLNGRFYIMVQLVDPPGSARVEQLSDDNHNITGFIAKAVLINTTVRTIDKGHPSVYKFFPARRITQLHFRFLNPDHSLYQLNGHRWAMTLRCYA